MYLVMLLPQFLTYRAEHIVTATILSINSLLLSSSVLAQIVPDGTLNTQVNLEEGQQKIQKITGGIESGKNLFHSFKEFSPTADFDTHFDNNNSIQNIFTRVTGNSASLIDGLIKTNGSASLFILNPAGIIFGNNAELDIGGSFITTTAESIIFADGTKFDTQLDQTSPLLTVSIPIGLQYGNSPGAIYTSNSNNSETIKLNVSPENTIAFLGGNIELQNISIEAFSGNVEIGSVAEGQIVSLSPSSKGWEFNYDNVGKFNDIKISQQSHINISGQQGIVNLRGKDIFLNPGFQIFNFTNSDFDGGSRSSISLLATNYIDLNNIAIGPSTPNQDSVRGDIIIKAKDIKIRNGSLIRSKPDQGDGGNIRIDASESLELSDFNELRSSLIFTGINDSGKGGNIKINTGKLVITDGSRIDSSTFGSGTAGSIVVNAHESIFISGSSPIFNSGLFASSGDESLPFEEQNPNLGESGSLIVDTPRLSIEDGGEISVSNFGTGNAGDININNVGELLLNNDSQITAITASGNGGLINVNGSEIVLRDNATIGATADFDEDGGNGNGGNITIEANNLVLFDNSNINANANLGSGGNINITTKGLFTQKNPEKMITASSQLGVDGVVEINNPDQTSKLETTQLRVSTLAAEESIYTGCSLGTDFEANKFSYIGRGGMRKSPFESVGTKEFIGDLGLDEWAFQAAELNTNKNPNNPMIDKTTKSIIEATTWIVNSQGNVELIAQASNDPLPSDCLFK